MKKTTFIAILFIASMSINAQSLLGNALSKLADKAGIPTEAVSIAEQLIGTKKVSESSLEGTWVYTQPAVAFESDNLLTQAGGQVASSTVEKKAKEAFNKIGIKEGDLKITFKADKTFIATIGNKKTTGTYNINEATITFTGKMIKKSISANVKLSGNTMQITFKADKLLSFATTVASLSQNTTLSTVSALMKKFKGMQVGMKYKKQ